MRKMKEGDSVKWLRNVIERAVNADDLYDEGDFLHAFCNSCEFFACNDCALGTFPGDIDCARKMLACDIDDAVKDTHDKILALMAEAGCI